MRRDLIDVHLGTRPRDVRDRAVEDDANKRLAEAVRSGRNLERFGDGEPVDFEIGRDYAVQYALEVFADDVRSWAEREAGGFLDWVLKPSRHHSVAVFQTLSADGETAPEWAVEVWVEAARDGVRVDGGLIGRVDAAAMDAREVVA